MHQRKYKNIHYTFPEPILPITNTLSTFFSKKFKRDFSHTIRCGGRGSKITSSFNWANYYLEDNSIFTLSIDDCKKLQNFPDNFVLKGSKTAQWKQLGNTIPVNLSYYVLKNLIDILKK